MRRHDIINYLIEQNGYTKYLEIGVDNPENNFHKIKASMKEGVDPAGRCHYQMTSDQFFTDIPSHIKWDIIFIDGLHTAAQVFKDLINSINRLKPGGSIVVHDCNPPTQWHTRPIEQFQFDKGPWNGTTYKGFLYFKQLHPKLRIHTVNTDWGCGVIQNPRQIEITTPLDLVIDWQGLPPSWEDFEKYRKDYLNLIDIEVFQKIYKISWHQKLWNAIKP